MKMKKKKAPEPVMRQKPACKFEVLRTLFEMAKKKRNGDAPLTHAKGD